MIVDLDEIRALTVRDLAICRAARDLAAGTLRRLEAAGTLAPGYRATLTLQRETYDRWIARYETEIAA